MEKGEFLEQAASSTSRVDRARGIIHDVRILGLTSRNRRRYTTQAVREAVPLYEGVVVNYNHAREEGIERPIEDRAGWLQNVRVAGDGGLIGDLHLLMADPRAAKILETAEKNPSLIGLSHAAQGQWDMEDGVKVVRKIEKVKSVDLVTDAASVNSLFESRRRRPSVVRSVGEFVRRLRGKFFEQTGGDSMDEPMLTMDQGQTTDDIKRKCGDAAVRILNNDDLSDTEKIEQFRALVRSRGKALTNAEDIDTLLADLTDKREPGDQAAVGSAMESCRPGSPKDVSEFIARLRGEHPQQRAEDRLNRAVRGVKREADSLTEALRRFARREAADGPGNVPVDVKSFVRQLRGGGSVRS